MVAGAGLTPNNSSIRDAASMAQVSWMKTFSWDQASSLKLPLTCFVSTFCTEGSLEQGTGLCIVQSALVLLLHA